MWPSLEHFPCLAFFKSVKGARYPALIGHRMIILSTLHHAALWGYHKLIWKMWGKPYWILPRHACRRTRVKLCQRLRLNPRVYCQMETDKPIVCLPRPNYEIKSTISLFFMNISYIYVTHDSKLLNALRWWPLSLVTKLCNSLRRSQGFFKDFYDVNTKDRHVILETERPLMENTANQMSSRS